MKIRIAAIGSEAMIKRVLEYKNKLKNIEVKPFVYQRPEESPELIRRIGSNFNVLFFTGPVPYFFAKQEIENLGIPAVYIPFDEYMFSISLYHTKVNQIKNKRISVDIPEPEHVYQVLKELNIDSKNLYVRGYKNESLKGTFNSNEIISYHYELWKNKKVDLIMTSISSVYEKLQKLDVKCARMVIPEKNILDTIRQAKNIGEFYISKKMQLVFGFVSINGYEDLLQKKGDYALQQINLNLHKKLLDLGKEVHASFQYLGKGEYIMFGTRGSLDLITNHFNELPIIPDLIKNIGVDVRMGFGFGLSAKEAESNAYVALNHSKLESTSCGFIVTEEKVIIGPLNKDNNEFHLKTDNIEVYQISEKTGMSVINISKVLHFLKIREYQAFTAHELSDYLGVSKRTSERIIKKLVENEFLDIIGEEQPYTKGRPRSLYGIK